MCVRDTKNSLTARIGLGNTRTVFAPSASSSKLLRYYIHEALEEHCQRGDLVEVIRRHWMLEKEE